jgi:hypothetical protein
MRERTAKNRNKKKTAKFATDDPRANSSPTCDNLLPIKDSVVGRLGILIIGGDGSVKRDPVGKTGMTLSCKPWSAAMSNVT